MEPNHAPRASMVAFDEKLGKLIHEAEEQEGSEADSYPSVTDVE